MSEEPKIAKSEDASAADRREFLKTAGRFAVVVPPTMTFLLSTTMTSPAIAKSGHCNSGRGNGDDEGDPGNSGGHNQGGDDTGNPC